MDSFLYIEASVIKYQKMNSDVVLEKSAVVSWSTALQFITWCFIYFIIDNCTLMGIRRNNKIIYC